jgi:hypothetical protein
MIAAHLDSHMRITGIFQFRTGTYFCRVFCNILICTVQELAVLWIRIRKDPKLFVDTDP